MEAKQVKRYDSKTIPQRKQTIEGAPPSKSNMYKIVQFKGRASLAKTDAMKDYEKSFYLQCNVYRNAGIKGFFELHVDAFLPSNRQDLDNLLKAILDCLQQCKAIENDRNCVKIVAQKFVDKVKPRIEFTILEV
jgi:Holliday junction resolvase RusA-like endonuclease